MLLARVQGHPARAHLHGPLVEALGIPAEVCLHSSTPPNPWEGYKACLRDIPDCSHLLVIQDDARPALNFAAALEQIAKRNPSTPVVLFLAKLPRRISVLALRAAKNREAYVGTGMRQSEFCPVVAILWPRKKAEEFLTWAEENPRRLGHPSPRSDDGVLGRWAAFTHQLIRFSVPSIVQHDDREDSLIGRQAMWGKDSGRTALLFAEDASVVSW